MANHSFCENCGTPCPLGDTLCASCASQVQTEFDRPNPDPRQKEPRRSGGNKMLVPIIIGILVIVIAIVAILTIFKVFKTDDTTQETTTQETTIQDPTGDASSDTVEPAPSDEEETPAQATIHCVECEASIPETAQFCPYCGESQTVTEEEEIEEEPEPITMELVDADDVPTSSLDKVGVSSASATSVIQQKKKSDNTAAVTLDGDLTSSWQEGVEGAGVGEGLIYNLDGEYYIQYFSFNLGNWRTADWYETNNVPQALDIVINEEIYRVSFPYGQTKFWVELSEPVLTNCVEMYIAAAYPGTKYNDTCIAEVGIYGEPA